MVLWHDPQITFNAWNFDKWRVSLDKEGRDIYTAAFGYVVSVGGDGMPVSGVRVDCYVEHCDITGAHYDIWAKMAPIGKPYGYVYGYPRNTSTWDFDESHATVKTNSDGKAAFFIGLGDPNENNTNYSWLWPSAGNDMVLTGVKLRFVVPRRVGDLVYECHCYFIRYQYAGFWLPAGAGVFDNSASLLVPPPEIWPLSIDDEMVSMIEVTIEPTIKMRIDKPEEYPLLFKKKPMIHAAESWTYEGGEWAQLVWDAAQGWIWVTPTVMRALVSPNPEDPNDAISMLSVSEPYAFFCDVAVNDADKYKADTHTVLLMSKTESGGLVSVRRIWMQVYDRDQNRLLMKSEYIVPIDDRMGEGRYYDWWGYPGTFIYVAENGYLELMVDDFYGDFNFDGFINLKDFSLFANKWGQGLTNEGYDLIYDGTQDGQTDLGDLRVFAENWLTARFFGFVLEPK